MTNEQVHQIVIDICGDQLWEMNLHQAECAVGTIVSYFIYKKSQITNRPSNAVMVEFLDKIISAHEEITIPVLAQAAETR